MAPDPPGITVGVLGPLEVRRDGAPLRLRGKERAVLALLALSAGRTVSLDRLLDGLWGDEPPQSAQNMLHVYVSRLRRLLEPDLHEGARSSMLVRHGTGYELRLDPERIDLTRFERLLAEARGAGDAAIALGRLEEALAVWRGDALADVAHEPFAAREAPRLEELRLAAIEDRIDAQLALGRHGEVVGELERIVVEQPLRERPRAQLMLALYRSGRQADALASFQDARRELVGELGIEPGAALRELERAILQQDPSLDVEAAAAPTAAAPVESRKVVTAVFVELAPPAIDPEALRDVFAEAAAGAAAVLERYGASCERPVADLVVGVFGVPTLHEDDAVRALHAAEELRESSTVPVRVALVTGETVAGAGPLLGLRPARMPAVGEIEIDAATQRLAARPAPKEVPFVGRGDELRQVRAAYERALRDRTAYLFTVLGPAGIGKSRFAEELALHLPEARLLRARCLPYGAAALAPIAEILEEAGGELESGAPREETFLSVRRLLSALARERPLVVVLDDVHWAEPTMLDLVEQLADLVRDAPLLLLCLAREELLDGRPSWGGGKRNATSVLLEPLSEDESQQLVDELLAGVDEATRARVITAAEGNPLFIEQLLAALAEGDETIPPLINALLSARVDRLEGAERAVLQAAAVVGKEFTSAAVAELVPSTPADVERALDGLVRKELVRPDAEEYRFRHVLIRDAAYGLIPKAARAELHLRCAERELDELAGYHLEQAHGYAVELGRPDAPELAALAAESLGAAARRAYTRGEDNSAAALWERTLALVSQPSRDGTEALIGLGEAARYAGDYERAGTAAAEAVAAARELGDSRVEWLARMALLLVRRRTDPQAMLYVPDEVESAIAAFDADTDHRGLAHAYDALVEIAFSHCRGAETEDAALRAIDFAEKAGDVRTRMRAEAYLLAAALFGPLPVADAVRRCEATLAAPPTARLAATALRAFCGLRAMEGRFDEARDLRRRAEDAYRELGLHAAVASSSEVFAHVELLAGDAAAAERTLLEASDVFVRVGDRSALSTMDGLLALAALRQGREDDALAFSERSAAAAGDADLATQVQWRSVKAEVLALRGALDDAERLAREAVDIAERTDFPNLRGDALVTLAAVSAGEDGRAALERALELYEQKGNVVSVERVRKRLAAPAPA